MSWQNFTLNNILVEKKEPVNVSARKKLHEMPIPY